MSVRSCSFAVFFYNPSDGCKFESVFLCKEVCSVTANIIVVDILFSAFCRLIHPWRSYHHPVLHFTSVHHFEFKQVPLVNDDLVNDRPPYTGFGFAAYIIIGNSVKNSVLRNVTFDVTQVFYDRNAISNNTGVLSQHRYDDFVEYGV